jgi:cytochrome P450
VRRSEAGQVPTDSVTGAGEGQAIRAFGREARGRRGKVSFRFPPGPSLPLPVQTLLWQFQFPRYLRWCQKRYGDIFTVRLPLWGGRVVNVSDPSTIHTLFRDRGQLARAGEAYTVLEPILGRYSVELLDGVEHLLQRRMIWPSLHGPQLRSYAALIAAATAEEVARWPRGKIFPLLPSFQAVSLDVILRGVLGITGEDRLVRFRRLTRLVLDQRGVVPLAMVVGGLRRDFGPWKPWSKFLKSRAELFAAIDDEIHNRRAQRRNGGESDLLSAFLAADGHRQPPSDVETRDEVMTMIVAGHETTAAALAWFFDLVLHHPECLARLEADLGARDERYLEAAIQESMRLRPVIPLVARRLQQPFEIGQFRLPPGTVVAPNIVLSHLREKSYPDSVAFRPERFLEKSPDPSCWLPFGGGSRRCIGSALATFEMRIVIREVLSQVSLRPASPHMEKERLRAVTLVPRHGVRVIATSRAKGSAAA